MADFTFKPQKVANTPFAKEYERLRQDPLMMKYMKRSADAKDMRVNICLKTVNDPITEREFQYYYAE